MNKILKILKGPLSTFKKNRNGRVYTKELWEGVLQSEYWQDMMRHNTMCGEVVHPGDRTESDPMEIDVRNISHRIAEAHIEGDKLIGTVEVLDTKEGRNLLSLIDSGCTIGISARGIGDLDGDYVVPESYQFKCFDITMRPSDPNARLVPLTESERIKLVLNECEITDNFIEKEEVLKGSEETSFKQEVVNNFIEVINGTENLNAKIEKGNILILDDNDVKEDTLVIYAPKYSDTNYVDVMSIRTSLDMSLTEPINKEDIQIYINKIKKYYAADEEGNKLYRNTNEGLNAGE